MLLNSKQKIEKTTKTMFKKYEINKKGVCYQRLRTFQSLKKH